jgi:hypothetical protein
VPWKEVWAGEEARVLLISSRPREVPQHRGGWEASGRPQDNIFLFLFLAEHKRACTPGDFIVTVLRLTPLNRSTSRGRSTPPENSSDARTKKSNGKWKVRRKNWQRSSVAVPQNKQICFPGAHFPLNRPRVNATRPFKKREPLRERKE